jgi:hypothetical protein
VAPASVEYLKTFRLSVGPGPPRLPARQASGAHDWHLGRAADEPSARPTQGLLIRLRNAGFGHLLKPHILREHCPREWTGPQGHVVARAPQLTTSRLAFSSRAGLNRIVVVAAIMIGAPVFGWIPGLAGCSTRVNVPKPGWLKRPSCRSACSIPENAASSTCPICAAVKPAAPSAFWTHSISSRRVTRRP